MSSGDIASEGLLVGVSAVEAPLPAPFSAPAAAHGAATNATPGVAAPEHVEAEDFSAEPLVQRLASKELRRRTSARVSHFLHWSNVFLMKI